jgi:multiple sugar transport system substrate-binding protein
MTASDKPVDTTSPKTGGLNRRQAMAATGLALGSALLPLAPRRAKAADRAQITFASANFYGRETIAQVVDMYNQSQSKVQVTFVQLPPPSSSTEVHQELVQQLARRNGTPDVFTQDVIWIAEFASAGWALPLDQYFGPSVQAAYFPGLIQACTFRGKLTALPWHVDSGMLYYRKDLLQQAGAQVPTSWADMTAIAQKIQQSGGAKFGYLWQGKQAEVLVCDLVEVIGSAGGGILAPDGKTVLIAEPPAVEGVQFLYDTINKSKISPQDVLSWDEEPSRGPFTSGQSVFLRNWSYVYKIAQDKTDSSVVGKVGVAPLPHFPGGKSAACLGGYQYGVNAHTQNRDAAIDFITWMSSPATQLHYAVGLGLAPTRPAVFEEPQLIQQQPFMHTLKDVFVGATPRPVTPNYPQVTLALQSAVSRALVNGDVQTELNHAKERITAIVS